MVTLKSWDQLFRSHTERLWFRPPPTSVAQDVVDRGRVGDRYGQPTKLKQPKNKPKDKPSGKGFGGKKHTPDKHHRKKGHR